MDQEDIGLMAKMKFHYHIIRQAISEEMNPPIIEEDTTIVYLDQKQWIQIAEHKRGEKSDPEIKKAVELVQSTSDSGQVVYPISAVHLFETASRADDKSRNNLIDTMLEISDLYTMIPPDWIEKSEAKWYVEGKKGQNSEVRNQVFQKGLTNIVTGPDESLLRESDPLTKEQAEMVEILFRTKYGFKFALNQESIMSNLSDRSYEYDVKNYIENRLHRYSNVSSSERKKRRRKAIFGYFRSNIQGHIEELYEERDEAVNIPEKEEIDAWVQGDEKSEIETFFQQFPMLYVYLTLTFARNLEVDDSIDKNDLHDLLSLSPALGYADVVLMENDWTRRYYQYDLHEVYDTEVRNDLKDLPEILDSER